MLFHLTSGYLPQPHLAATLSVNTDSDHWHVSLIQSTRLFGGEQITHRTSDLVSQIKVPFWILVRPVDVTR
ncbi:hypothetical protein SCLCIDRAFT_1213728 [Scleroderma citrinum Foug A]|uniref:Uncharacterized protein n=1 Tax=Scleroderma citrinum Foug A TaxID=1036808 RepID=A0A0C2ZQS3_9AGAM|nr:hypothetical protein SCLCIDRAFT_1213728 [Scleroderma citrinum Foug A]